MDDAYGDPRNYDPNDDPYNTPAPPPPPAPAPITWGQMNPPHNVEGGWQDEHTGGFVPANLATEAPMGLGYWASRGVPPDQIFDFATGQIRPEFRHTARGYERNAVAGPSTGAAGGGGNYGADPFSLPYTGGGGGGGGFSVEGAPRPNYPSYQAAPAFAFDPFTPSSWADAENEPGYKASREQLRKQIEAGAAHRGVLRSGMTIGDLYSNLDALGQQNFKTFDDRRFRNWSGNMGLAKTKHDFLVQDIDRGNNYRFNAADAEFKGLLDGWKTKVGALTSLARPVD